jgi:hypothetical protein
VTLFWAAISALAVFYFRESIKLAHKQKAVVSRLDAYLHHWSLKLLEGNDGDYKLTSIGFKWAEKYYSCKTTEEIISVDKKFNEGLDEIKKEFILNGVFEEYITSINNKIKEQSESTQVLQSIIREYRRDFIDGKIFPSDSDLSVIDPLALKMAVGLKLNIASLLESLSILVGNIDKEPNHIKLSDSVWELYVSWLKINRDKKLLAKYTEKTISTSVISLALNNFSSGL